MIDSGYSEIAVIFAAGYLRLQATRSAERKESAYKSSPWFEKPLSPLDSLACQSDDSQSCNPFQLPLFQGVTHG